jgi:hypothetical protein
VFRSFQGCKNASWRREAHWCEPIHRAWGNETPRRFGISKILEEFFGANKEDINRPYGRRRWALADNRLARKRLASPRAALRVYPNLQEPARVQTIRRIKEIFDQRKKPSLLWQPLSAEVTSRDFIASVLPERNSSLRKPQRNKTRQGVKVEFVGLD